MKEESAFRVLERQNESIYPSNTQPHYPKLCNVPLPHIASFDSLFKYGKGLGLLDIAVNLIPHVTVFDGSRDAPLSSRNKIEFWFSCPTVGVPIYEGGKGIINSLMYPSACRESGSSYRAKMQIKVNWRINNGTIQSEIRSLGF